jgi:hypothetical protein
MTADNPNGRTEGEAGAGGPDGDGAGRPLRSALRGPWIIRGKDRREGLQAWAVALLCLAVFGGIWWAYDRFVSRSIVVDVETGALEIVLSAELSGKTFQQARLCRARGEGEPRRTAEGPSLGCPRRTHVLSEPEAFVTPTLPAGTRLRITSRPRVFTISVLDMPDRYRGSTWQALEGGGIVLQGEAFDTFGSMTLRGHLTLGALHAATDQMSLVSGAYEIRGYTPLSIFDDDLRMLRSGALMAGALVRFTCADAAPFWRLHGIGDRCGAAARSGVEDAQIGRVYLSLPDPETSLMRVTAISDDAPHRLTVRYYFTDDVHIAPTLPEALIIDPLVQLLAAVLGAMAGYGWFRKLLLGIGEKG